MRRRAKFLLSSIVLAIGLLATQYVPLDFRILAIALFFFVTYAVSAWALFEDLNGVEWLTVVPLPGFYALSVALFYFLLPENIWSRIAVLGVFGIGMYALYLTANIYTVAKARTIQLLRAAHTIGILFSLLITLFLTDAVLSFHAPFWVNGIGIAFIAFPISLLSLWSIELHQKLEKEVVWMAVVVAILLGETAVILSFFPVTIWMASLYIVSDMYVLLGLLTTKLSGRLFQNAVWEYGAVWAVMTLMFFLLMPWK